MKYYKSVIILFVFWVFSACGDTSSSSDDDDLLPPTQGLVSSIEDARDNHVYSTTQIGTQVWLAENLQYKTTHSWCYDNVDSNCVIYGRLYGEGTDNLCPEEFHIPSQEEWQELINYVKIVKPDFEVARSLKSFTWHPGSDIFSFNLRGAGYRTVEGTYQDLYKETYLATSQSGCYLRFLPGTDYDFVCDDSIAGFSVRCLMDSTNAKDMLPSCGSSNRYEIVHEGSGFYTCDDMGWRPANSAEYNAFGKECVNGLVVEGNFYPEHYYDRYICDGGLWRDATEAERNTYGNECTAGNSQIVKGSVEDYKYFVCTDSGFRRTTLWDFPKSDYLNPSIEYGTIVDARDQKSYKTVSLGSQVWMAENLNYADSVNTSNLKANNWCYDNNQLNCEKVGRYYSFLAAMNLDESFAADTVIYPLTDVNQGICPDGWRIPSEEDWMTLVNYVLQTYGEEASAGLGVPNDYHTFRYAMKSVTGWNFDSWMDPGNASGFSSVPVGFRSEEGSFVSVGENDGFWLASIRRVWGGVVGNVNDGMDLPPGAFYAPRVSDMNVWQLDGLNYNIMKRKNGLPIRCIKN